MIHPHSFLTLSTTNAAEVPATGVGWGTLMLTTWLSGAEVSSFPPDDPGFDGFRWFKPRTTEDNVQGQVGSMDHTWNAAYALRNSARGVNGMHLIRGNDPYMEALRDGDSDINSDY